MCAAFLLFHHGLHSNLYISNARTVPGSRIQQLSNAAQPHVEKKCVLIKCTLDPKMGMWKSVPCVNNINVDLFEK